ncbi:hypothetical protein ABSL25_002895 [Yersinia enterocolitica]
MNTLAARYDCDTQYSIPHADFLRLQHAHNVGVTFLDMLETQSSLLHGITPLSPESFASMVALLTDQLGQVMNTCESQILSRMEAPIA